MTFPYFMFDAFSGDTAFMKLAAISIEILVLAALVCAVIFLFRIRSPRVRSLLYLLVLAKGVVGLAIGPVVPLGETWTLREARGWIVNMPAASRFSRTLCPAASLTEALWPGASVLVLTTFPESSSRATSRRP